MPLNQMYCLYVKARLGDQHPALVRVVAKERGWNCVRDPWLE